MTLKSKSYLLKNFLLYRIIQTRFENTDLLVLLFLSLFAIAILSRLSNIDDFIANLLEVFRFFKERVSLL